jgi:hypothetical protein
LSPTAIGLPLIEICYKVLSLNADRADQADCQELFFKKYPSDPPNPPDSRSKNNFLCFQTASQI